MKDMDNIIGRDKLENVGDEIFKSYNLKINILLAQYNQLREEVRLYIRTIDNTLLFILIANSGIFSVAISSNQYLLFLVCPLVVMFGLSIIGLRWYGINYPLTETIAKIETEINDYVGENVLFWETMDIGDGHTRVAFVRYIEKYHPHVKIFGYFIVLMFLLIYGGATIIGLISLNKIYGTYISLTVGFVYVFPAIALPVIYYSYLGKPKY